MDYQTELLPISFVKLNSGLNTNGNPLNVNDQEASELDNVDFDRFGAFLQRNGYYYLNAAVPSVHSVAVPIAPGMPMGLLLSLTYATA